MAIAGFDRLAYPGNAMMIDLFTNTNMRWCGYYLAPTPNRPNSEWQGNRGNLAGLGWGLAPVYVGEQQYDPNQSYSTQISAAKGSVDGSDAVRLAGAEGFPANSVIYLDVETGGPVQQAMFDYVAAWQTAVVNTGYRPGIYCSYLVADQFRANAVTAQLFFWVFRMIDQGSNNNVYSNPFPVSDPANSSIAYASMWQYAQGQFGAAITWPSGNLQDIDMDVSTIADPSSPPSRRPLAKPEACKL